MSVRRLLLTLKVASEWVTGLVLVIALLPLFLLIALLIKLTSKGPVFYIAERVGPGGRPFNMIKFRSMHVDAPEIITDDDKVIVEKNDPRITPIGGILRLGFDEIPQLINVVKGEMGIVGPRPDATWMLPKYTDEIRPRLEMKPGISGLAQVLQGRDLSTWDNYRLDVWYVQNWSPLVDLKIVLYTMPYVTGSLSIGRKWLTRIMPDVAASLDAEQDAEDDAPPNSEPTPE